MLAALDCAKRIGVEPNAAAREVATSKGLTVFESIEELSDESVDVVVSNHALEHALEPYRELVALRSKLVSGGRLVVRVPIEDWRSRRQRRRFDRDPNHHIYTWTPLLFFNLLTEAHFQVQECRVVTHAWPPPYGLWAKAPAAVHDAAGRIWSMIRRRRQLQACAHRH